MKILEFRHLDSSGAMVILEISLESKITTECFRYLRRCGMLDYYVYPYFRCKFFNEQLVLLGAIGNKTAKLWINAGFEDVLLENLTILLQVADAFPESVRNSAETSL